MARSAKIDTEQVHELLLQALETERGGIQVYTAAIKATRAPAATRRTSTR